MGGLLLFLPNCAIFGILRSFSLCEYFMQLFSKRNKASAQKPNFLEDSLRTRLLQEIEYIVSTNEFLEKCFLVNDEKNSRWFLEEESMRSLSLRELGYDITDFFNFKPHSLDSKSFYPKKEEGEPINDYALFDLIEILLIFCKEDIRALVREGFQKHFMEEGGQYVTHNFLIAQKDTAGIKPYVSFLKDRILREKLEQYYGADSGRVKDYGLLARISADVIQFLFSGEKKKETKKRTEEIVKGIAEKCVEKNDATSFSELLNRIILDAKSLNNEISNIRHTDRSTLLVDNPSVFKLIAANNIYLTELVIFADPERHFFSQKAEDFKNEYITKYKIPIEGWIIKNPKKDDDEIDATSIPF